MQLKNPVRVLLIVLVLALCLSSLPAPMSGIGRTEAAPTPCDNTLFFAGIITAMGDPAPPDLNPHEMHWEFAEGNYRVSYRWTNGAGGYVQRVTVYQGRRTVGVATNGTWSICAKGNAWKRYLLGHLP